MKKFWKIKALSDEEGELLLYGEIGNDDWADVNAVQFVQDIAGLGDVKSIKVRINSPGGSVFAGQSIYSTLKRHKADVTVYVDGLAASIASIVAMAGNKVIMPRNSMMMIHNPWTISVGNSQDMRKAADRLDSIRETIINVYEEKTSQTRERITEMMDEETWMSAEQAKDLGFADVIEGDTEALALSGDFRASLSRYKNVPVRLMGTIEDKGGRDEDMEITVENIKEKYPDIFNAIRDEAYKKGVEAERGRIKAIEDLDIKGYEDILSKAKFEDGISAEAVALEIVKAEKTQRSDYLGKLGQDAKAACGIVPSDLSEEDKAETDMVVGTMVKAADMRRGSK